MGSGDWTLFQQLDYSYNIIWLCLALPISMVGFAVFGRIEVYDSPVIFQLLENGKEFYGCRENKVVFLNFLCYNAKKAGFPPRRKP